MRQESPHKPTDISEVIDLALDYNPNLAMADLGTIRMWVAEGCTVKDDILPVMKRVMAKKKGITVFKYFTTPILESRDKRLVKATIAKPEEKTQAEKDAIRAKNLRWHRDRGICSTSVGPADYKWLEAYDSKENPRTVATPAGACWVSNEAPQQTLMESQLD
jgi:hypothetical protein